MSEKLFVTIKETNIEVYRVGKSEKCIIWNYDVFGFDGGRTRQMADFVSDHGELQFWKTINQNQ